MTQFVPYPSPGRSWRLVALIVLAGIVATIDRGVLSLVIDPILYDLGISDIQISLRQRLSFSLFCATVGLALGLGADRFMRGRLLALGILVWSLDTIAAGLSNRFWRCSPRACWSAWTRARSAPAPSR